MQKLIFSSVLFLHILLLQACHSPSTEAPQQTVDKNLNTASYNVQLGLGYLQQNNLPRAKKKLLKALALAPRSPEVNTALAYYFEKTSEDEEAKRYYQQALNLAPTNGAQLSNYGAFLCRTGHYQEAELYFLKAVKDLTYVHTAAAYENAGLCASAIPDYAKATDYFLKALNNDPHRQQSLVELVNLTLKQKQANKALEYLQHHAELTFAEPALLALAVKVAEQANQIHLATQYKLQLDKLMTDSHSGVNNEYYSTTG